MLDDDLDPHAQQALGVELLELRRRQVAPHDLLHFLPEVRLLVERRRVRPRPDAETLALVVGRLGLIDHAEDIALAELGLNFFERRDIDHHRLDGAVGFRVWGEVAAFFF